MSVTVEISNDVFVIDVYHLIDRFSR